MNKDNDINIGSIKDDVEKAKELIQKMRNKRVIQVRETWDDDYGYIKALENIVSDYTRQKQINEEHQKLNGELREKVKKIEEKNKHLSNVNDYETISLECTHLEEQLEIANSKIQELEEENMQKDLETIGTKEYTEANMKEIIEKYYTANEDCILKQKVKQGLEDIEDYFDRLNGPDEDIEYIRHVKQEILEEEK